MIKVSFSSAGNVCDLVENTLTDHLSIEDWLIKQIPAIAFDCMDYPHDLETNYDCYFRSDDEEAASHHIYSLLHENLMDDQQVAFSVSIVDQHFTHIKGVTFDTIKYLEK